MKDYPFSLKLKNKFDPIINLDRIYEYGSGRHILEKVFENENEISKLATEDLKMLNTVPSGMIVDYKGNIQAFFTNIDVSYKSDASYKNL